MIAYEEVKTDQDYEEFLSLMLAQMAEYLENLMKLMGMSVEELGNLLRTVGQVCRIDKNRENAGFYWVEKRGRELHIHGIVVKDAYQGQGIGTATLRMLEEQHKNERDFIELGVHQSNHGAIRLYKKLGYRIETTREDLGFHIMRKPLS